MNTLSLPDYCDVEKPNMFLALAPERPASPICGSDNDSDDDRFEVIIPLLQPYENFNFA